MDTNILIGSTPSITEYNYFASFLNTFLEDWIAKQGTRFSVLSLTRAKSGLSQFLKSPEVVAKCGFDATFHFRLDLVADPRSKKITVCLNPLTPLALDCCLALKIPVDDSLVAQIRKSYNESLAQAAMEKPDNAQ